MYEDSELLVSISNQLQEVSLGTYTQPLILTWMTLLEVAFLNVRYGREIDSVTPNPSQDIRASQRVR